MVTHFHASLSRMALKLTLMPNLTACDAMCRFFFFQARETVIEPWHKLARYIPLDRSRLWRKLASRRERISSPTTATAAAASSNLRAHAPRGWSHRRKHRRGIVRLRRRRRRRLSRYLGREQQHSCASGRGGLDDGVN